MSGQFKQVLNRYNLKARQLIEQAYQFALQAHAGQNRQSGDPYISHCEMVAYKTAMLGLDSKAVVAALLHDVVEDTRFSSEVLRNNFGAEVATLVDGLTKLDAVAITKRWLIFGPEKRQELPKFERYIETLRKLFLASAKDLRVIIIKLADRLHNMETLKGLPQERQKSYAMETLQLYAPVAWRLGMSQIKGQLEDLAFPFAYPKQYQDIHKIAGPTYESCAAIAQFMRHKIEKLLQEQKIKASTDARPKHRYSLWRKLERYDNDLKKIYDLVAVRIIVDNVETCYKVLDLIQQQFPPMPERIKDYIAHPKPNGYQSLHTTVKTPAGQYLEVQIRTQSMHEVAEFGVAAHWLYKRQIPDYLTWIKEIETVGKRLKDPKELEKTLKIDFFGDRIFPVTPQSEVIDLPSGASVLDFAYTIHSEIGNHFAGAKVNGKMVKITTVLKSGDQVEILTNRKSHPSPDWIDLVKTAHARWAIRKALRLRGLIPSVLRRKVAS